MKVEILNEQITFMENYLGKLTDDDLLQFYSSSLDVFRYLAELQFRNKNEELYHEIKTKALEVQKTAYKMYENGCFESAKEKENIFYIIMFSSYFEDRPVFQGQILHMDETSKEYLCMSPEKENYNKKQRGYINHYNSNANRKGIRV